MSDTQSLIDNALFEYDKADNEVERLLDVIDRATIELEEARQIKRSAKIRLDEAIASAFRMPLSLSLEDDEYKDSSCSDSYYSSEGESSVHSSGSSESEEDVEERERSVSDNRSASPSVVEEEHDNFDIADEALEQIRYRLNVAKINPSSIQGASILDELLIRLKDTDDTISNDLIDEIMSDLLGNQKETYDDEEYSEYENKYHEDSQEEDSHVENIRIEVSRGGKVLGFYEGGLDERGYAREGEGVMYYNAGHVYSGDWKDDVQAGYGVYQWTDGHVYEVSERLCVFLYLMYACF